MYTLNKFAFRVDIGLHSRMQILWVKEGAPSNPLFDWVEAWDLYGVN